MLENIGTYKFKDEIFDVNDLQRFSSMIDIITVNN